jgi:hypothetical protein
MGERKAEREKRRTVEVGLLVYFDMILKRVNLRKI